MEVRTIGTKKFKFESWEDAKDYYNKREMHEEVEDISKFHARLRGRVLCFNDTEGKTYPATNVFLDTLLSRLHIPKPYARIIAPDLLLTNINERLKAAEGNNATLRIADGKAMAFLGPKYSPINNQQIIQMIGDKYPSVKKGKEKFVVNDNGAMFRAAFTTGDKVSVKPRDIQKVGFNVVNSETGHRACFEELYLFRMICSNGMIVGERQYTEKFIHRGNTKDLPERFWDALERLADHIPMYMESLLKSIKFQVGKTIVKYADFIDETMGIEFLESLSPEDNAYDVINAITLRAKEFDIVRQMEAERLGGILLESVTGMKPHIKEITNN